MSSPPRYRIHPAIGIARVGNADANSFFLGPERPAQEVRGDPTIGTQVPPFKTGGLIKRQAVRYRVWEYVEKGGVWSPSREVGSTDKDVVDLTWTVHLANRKASFYKFQGLAGSPLLAKQPSMPRRNRAVADRRTLEIDPLPRSISGANAAVVPIDKGGSGSPNELWPNPQPVPPITSLGQLRTDDHGRLIVVPGGGVASGRPGAKITQYANNDGWFDDACDGPVTATLRLKVNGKTTTVPVQGAWLIVGPPDFAPDLPQMVTLYDVLFDVAARSGKIPTDEAVYQVGSLARLSAIAKDLAGGKTALSAYKVSFDADVASILRAAIVSAWTFEPAQHAHTTLGGGSSLAAFWPMISDPAQPNALRAAIFSRLRKPNTMGAAPPADMPRLLGDDPYNKLKTGRIGLSVTITQYAILQKWAAGAFIGSALGPASLLTPPPAPAVSPDGLDRAALEFASGGAFFPGIEVGWLIREASIFAEPFRIKKGASSTYVGDKPGTTVGAGYFSRQMALPWLADFLQCKTEQQALAVPKSDWGWWPSQRPDFVYATAADAAAVGTMKAWTRATVGASSAWPAPVPADDPPGRPPEMPSYSQMISHWWKLGFIVNTPGKGFAESDRASNIP